MKNITYEPDTKDNREKYYELISSYPVSDGRWFTNPSDKIVFTLSDDMMVEFYEYLVNRTKKMGRSTN